MVISSPKSYITSKNITYIAGGNIFRPLVENKDMGLAHARSLKAVWRGYKALALLERGHMNEKKAALMGRAAFILVTGPKA